MAQYIEGDDRSQVMLLPPAVDDYVSAASPVRAIDAFVDQLDLANLGFKIRTAASEGRSSYDPATLLKLYLWATSSAPARAAGSKPPAPKTCRPSG